MKRILIAISVVFLVAASVAEAQCGGANLVANCSFEDGVTGWSVEADSWFQSGTARSGSSSLELDAEEISSFQIDTKLQQCVQVSGDVTYETGFYARMVIGEASCWPRVSWHGNTSCTAFLSSNSFPAAPVAPGATWTMFTEEKTSPAGAQSASFDMACTHGNDDFVVLYDDAFFWEAGMIFTDGFESGNPGSWSSTMQ